MTKINYSTLPADLEPYMRRYIEFGRAPTPFLTAILSSSLAEALDDSERVEGDMFPVIEFLSDEAPLRCWGSDAAVREWIGIGGLRGVHLAQQEIREMSAKRRALLVGRR